MNNNVVKVASFSDGDVGGNPAGVHISEKHPGVSDMQSIAAEIGYSETAFAEPGFTEPGFTEPGFTEPGFTEPGFTELGVEGWRVRYFSPESEVPFCGHATVALGAVLAKQKGAGVYPLILNNTTITVEGFIQANQYSAALQSPQTLSRSADPTMVADALTLFGYQHSDLDPDIPPAFANGGANHLIIGLNTRDALRAMDYKLSVGRDFMNNAKLVTVMLVFSETAQTFHTRNPFASGGVHEDPATGAATAAFAGYLRDLQWPHNGVINIIQGEDMGSRSLIRAELDNTPGASIRVSGSVRFL